MCDPSGNLCQYLDLFIHINHFVPPKNYTCAVVSDVTRRDQIINKNVVHSYEELDIYNYVFLRFVT